VTLAYTALLIFRSKEPAQSRRNSNPTVARGAFLFNNLMLVGHRHSQLFWGTIFPCCQKRCAGVKITVGPRSSIAVNGPLALGLVFLMGIGPLIAWRRTSDQQSRPEFRAAVTIGVATGIVAAVGGIANGTC